MTQSVEASGRLSTEDEKPHPVLPHLQELEVWRALAAFAVLLTHAGFMSGAIGRHVLPGFLARMDIGVAVFFVLSGFLLYRPHAIAVARGESPPRLRRYAIRRVARIGPAWAAVLVGVLFLVPETRSASRAQWLANLVHVQALRVEWDLPGLAQLWSLSTEVAFYIALPIIAYVIRRLTLNRSAITQLSAVAGLVVVAWLFRWAAHSWLPETFAWHRTLPAMLDWFAVGMVLAVIMSFHERWALAIHVLRRSGNAFLLSAASIFWVLTTSLAGPYDLSAPSLWQASVKHGGYAVVALLLIYPSALGAHTVLTGLLTSRPLAYLGKISYAFFLWHMPVMFWVRATLGHELFTGHFWSTVIITTGVTLALSALSWHLLERPVLGVARRRS
ncbi:MAG: acyltransferase [Actinomycetales bacterium]|nr:acyltransferase [Dietzia sp.]NLW98981.1 acyltransferase [Actinomycetales bacterium]